MHPHAMHFQRLCDLEIKSWHLKLSKHTGQQSYLYACKRKRSRNKTKRNKTQNKQATTTNKTEGSKEQKEEEEERLPFISNRHKAAGCENNAHDQI